MKIKIAIGVAVAIVVGILFGLFHGNDEKIPSEKKMARILADVYFVDAMYQVRGNFYSSGSSSRSDKSTESAYHTVLQHYDMTKADFDTAVAWYAKRPEQYVRVYDMVISILSKREGDYKVILNKRDSISNLITQKNDSLRITLFKIPQNIHVPVEPRDSIKEKNLRFSYPLDSLRGGTMHLKLGYIFQRKNEAKSPANVQLIVHYNDAIIDTTSAKLTYSYASKVVELDYKLRDTLAARKLQVNLLNTTDFKKVVANISEATVTYMPYLITDSVQFDEIQLPPIFAY